MRKYLIVFLMAGTAIAQETPPAPAPAPAAAPAPTATPAPTPVPTPPPSTREIINNLKDDELDKAIETLKSSFLDPALTDDKAMRRATLEGLIRRLSPGAAIVPNGSPAKGPAAAEFLAEVLDSRIGYVRVGLLDKDHLAQADAALSSFAEKKLGVVILDLRGTPPSSDFEVASEFARRFCPKGKLLFTLQKPIARQERIFTSNQDPVFQGVLIILTDADTTGAAEALAATLRLNAGALIVGSDTAGEALEFAESPIGGGATLRVAIARVTLPAGDPIFPNGVKPDIAISMPPDVQQEIFSMTKEKGVSQFVFDEERSRMNEAALVANLNPEIDSLQSQQRSKSNESLPRDTVLQRAVDLATAIGFYKGKQQ